MSLEGERVGWWLDWMDKEVDRRDAFESKGGRSRAPVNTDDKIQTPQGGRGGPGKGTGQGVEGGPFQPREGRAKASQARPRGSGASRAQMEDLIEEIGRWVELSMLPLRSSIGPLRHSPFSSRRRPPDPLSPMSPPPPASLLATVLAQTVALLPNWPVLLPLVLFGAPLLAVALNVSYQLV